MMKISHFHLSCGLMLNLVIASANAGLPGDKPAAEALAAIFDAEWEWALREAPTFASHLGDLGYNDRCPDASMRAFARRHEHRIGVLKQLDAIDVKSLSAEDKLNYRLFRRQYEIDVEEFQFHWHLVPVNHRDGIQDAGS